MIATRAVVLQRGPSRIVLNADASTSVVMTFEALYLGTDGSAAKAILDVTVDPTASLGALGAAIRSVVDANAARCGYLAPVNNLLAESLQKIP